MNCKRSYAANIAPLPMATALACILDGELGRSYQYFVPALNLNQ